MESKSLITATINKAIPIIDLHISAYARRIGFFLTSWGLYFESDAIGWIRNRYFNCFFLTIKNNLNIFSNANFGDMFGQTSISADAFCSHFRDQLRLGQIVWWFNLNCFCCSENKFRRNFKIIAFIIMFT